jgi:N5-hydroxy-L-ornithine N5-transacylase
MANHTDDSSSSAEDIVLKLPHPYLVEYVLDRAPSRSPLNARSVGGDKLYRVLPTNTTPGSEPPVVLHNPGLFFTEISTLKSSELPPQSNNSPWARARRSPGCSFIWDGNEPPTLAQVWLLIYVLLTIQPGMEQLRVEMEGKGSDLLGRQVRDVGLALNIPLDTDNILVEPDASHVLVLRSAFWQGAGSPFGPRPVWLPDSDPASLAALHLSSFPPMPLQHVMAPVAVSPTTTHLARHPLRAAKPRPGSVIYSRFIPHLRETFSMVVLDPSSEVHLSLFHTWQNDPRVTQGWDESGTLEHHRQHLQKLQASPSRMPVLARFDDTFFAYFELYWAKENRLGAYYDAGDFDRGRHSLVGDVSYRGPHRVTAWWGSLVHYLFLDETRTTHVVGEPKETNSTVVMYDLMHGFGVERFVDLESKRSALVRCSRERFFEICPLGEGEKVVGGLKIGLVPKL